MLEGRNPVLHFANKSSSAKSSTIIGDPSSPIPRIDESGLLWVFHRDSTVSRTASNCSAGNSAAASTIVFQSRPEAFGGAPIGEPVLQVEG